ncbi:MAG: hypothetical protein FJ255_04465 [Phycisphaerae bacterium]|nr:hypothetical protein [Phycisphaerae bacterium]
MTVVDDAVQQCRDLLDLLPAEALARAQERHPRVAGFAVFPVYAPVEIIHAAGLMPLGLFGVGNKLEITNADSRFQSFICSIAKSTLELFLRNEMKGFTGAVFSSICDVARNLASVAGRNAPGMYLEYLHLPQSSPTEACREFTRSEFRRFRDNLGARTGRPITDDAVARSLGLYNRVRALTRQLYQERRHRPGVLSAAELFTVAQACTRLMPEDAIPLLEDLAASLPMRKPVSRDCVRVVIEGSFCEQPPIELIEAIEAAGCHVVDDDLVVGWRLFRHDVPAGPDPVAALADAYVADSCYTSVRFNAAQPRTTGLLRRAKDAGADAVVFAAAKFCEPALLDYVLFRKALDEQGVPHLKIEFEEKMWTFDRLRTEVETFTESMLFE